MIILTVLILLAAAAWLLRARIQGILGLKWTILVTSIHNDSWEVSTRWYDRRAGSWRGIVTTVNDSDGVVSRLEGKPYYHSKQPMQSLESMKKYHMLARKRFFAKMQCEYLKDQINAARLSRVSQVSVQMVTAAKRSSAHLLDWTRPALRQFTRHFSAILPRFRAHG